MEAFNILSTVGWIYAEQNILFLNKVFLSYLFSYTEQNYKHNNLVFAPIFHDLNSKFKTFSTYTKGLFLSNIVHKSV